MPDDALEVLAPDRRRIERIVRRLRETSDPTERADLASELVRAASRYLDVVERAVVPRLEGVVPAAELEAEAQSRHALRDAMTVVHDRTSHIAPRNVHVSDPEGFEGALHDVVHLLEQHLGTEDRSVAALLDGAGASGREELVAALERAAANASERPHPPRTAVGRALSNAQVKLDHTVEDVATPQHPGAEVIDDPSGS